MKMKTLRRLKAHATTAPRFVRRPSGSTFDVSDADDDFGPSPEVVFDRITGPFGSRLDPERPLGAGWRSGSSIDEET